MNDKIEGYLEVGYNEKGEVVLNLDKDRNGVGHIILSPGQARTLAEKLNKKADEARVQRIKTEYVTQRNHHHSMQ